eukprot:TRINITY_DN5136_c0_g1_i1.p1 TRINITY_DN5136_c0_g1~~TRINITY_DN5136_c0_g1_i1.p1  ORF type:complete len:325 (+),score=83.51 TRINITY_DN5136_c0_g1_i1:46-1020(+)
MAAAVSDGAATAAEAWTCERSPASASAVPFGRGRHRGRGLQGRGGRFGGRAGALGGRGPFYNIGYALGGPAATDEVWGAGGSCWSNAWDGSAGMPGAFAWQADAWNGPWCDSNINVDWTAWPAQPLAWHAGATGASWSWPPDVGDGGSISCTSGSAPSRPARRRRPAQEEAATGAVAGAGAGAGAVAGAGTGAGAGPGAGARAQTLARVGAGAVAAAGAGTGAERAAADGADGGASAAALKAEAHVAKEVRQPWEISADELCETCGRAQCRFGPRCNRGNGRCRFCHCNMEPPTVPPPPRHQNRMKLESLRALRKALQEDVEAT